MRKLVVLTFVSLDGVMQAPGGPEEDPSEDFKLGGWTAPLFDETMGEEMSKQMTPPFDTLLGRKTYDLFAEYWPKHSDVDPFGDGTKYVVSHEPFTPVDNWGKIVVLSSDAVSEVKKLKEQDGPMLQVHGSSNFIQTLLKNDLVDELWLKIFPVTLSKGKRLFGKGVKTAAFKLMESKVSPSGVIIATYKRNGEVKLGSF